LISLNPFRELSVDSWQTCLAAVKPASTASKLYPKRSLDLLDNLAGLQLEIFWTIFTFDRMLGGMA
jgi:hypothetical protein